MFLSEHLKPEGKKINRNFTVHSSRATLLLSEWDSSPVFGSREDYTCTSAGQSLLAVEGNAGLLGQAACFPSGVGETYLCGY